MKLMILTPANHPINGIRAWNNPKKNPVFNASINGICLCMAKPLVIDAENESIANAMAMSIMVISKSTTHFRDYSQNYPERKKVFYQCINFDFHSGEIQNAVKSHEWELHPYGVEIFPSKPQFFGNFTRYPIKCLANQRANSRNRFNSVS